MKNAVTGTSLIIRRVSQRVSTQQQQQQQQHQHQQQAIHPPTTPKATRSQSRTRTSSAAGLIKTEPDNTNNLQQQHTNKRVKLQIKCELPVTPESKKFSSATPITPSKQPTIKSEPVSNLNIEVKSEPKSEPKDEPLDERNMLLESPSRSTSKSGRVMKSSPTKSAIAPQAPPSDFYQVWDLITEMRKSRDAPVDLHGSEILGDWQPEGASKMQSVEEYRFSVLVALMLSSQTKDDVTGFAVRALKTEAHKRNLAFGPEFMISIGATKVDELIRKVGFHNNKTKFLIQSSELMLDTTWGKDESRQKGSVPSHPKDLLALPGIGPKMGYLISTIAFKGQFGLGIDTHMHRIFHDLKWTDDKAFKSGAEATRVVIESWLPKEYWDTINYLIVGFGQQAQQQRGMMLRKVVCHKTSGFPKEKAIPALKLLQQAGGLSKVTKTKYLDYTEKGTKETPLMWAAQSGNEEMIQFLINSGDADIKAKDKKKQTAADHAKHHKHSKVLHLLMDPIRKEEP